MVLFLAFARDSSTPNDPKEPALSEVEGSVGMTTKRESPILIKNIEQWGTGTLEMIKETVKHGLPEPEFEDTGTSIVVTFRKPKSLHEDDLSGLNERQKKVVEYVQRRGRVSNEEYQKLNKVNKKTSSRDLADLVTKGLLVKMGKTGRGTYYVLKGT